MNFDLEEAIKTIKQNKNFLKLNKITENNSGHNREVEYDHCVRTFEIAKKSISGNFIENSEAKNLFISYFNNEIGGIKKSSLIQIAALMHDIGKLVVFEKDGQIKTLGEQQDDGTFSSFPNHGYWGSVIVPEITKDLNLPENSLDYLTQLIDLHVVAAHIWLAGEITDPQDMLWQTKLLGRNHHVDILLSMYCDFYYHPLFQKYKKTMIDVFNLPNTYKPLNFKIMD